VTTIAWPVPASRAVKPSNSFLATAGDTQGIETMTAAGNTKRYGVPVVAMAAVFVALLVSAQAALCLEVRVVYLETGEPVAGAEVSILGRPGVARTDADGRFAWKPEPVPPFEVLVILPGGRYLKPVLVESLPARGVLVVEVGPLVEETVTVAGGAAPRIESPPASGTTLLAGRDIEVRQPVNLPQLLENVPGVSALSEGHAAVPAIRGLARGRTLILIDGARVTTERRVGPSATYLDPFVLEGVEVARGPGSVAYGSDALGGVIYARTRRVAPGTPLRARFQASLGAGVPERRLGAEVSKGTAKGGLLFQARRRSFDDYRSPKGEVFNSGADDQGFMFRAEHAVGNGTLSAGWQSDFGRNIERPRNNSTTVRFSYPVEDSHRLTASYDLDPVAGFSRLNFSGFLGSYAVITDQDRAQTSARPRSLERADVSARDFQFRAQADRIVGASRLELGFDANGRFGLRALDISTTYDHSGELSGRQEHVSVDQARRANTGVYVTAQTPLTPMLLASLGLRGDRIVTNNQGGYFGDRSTANSAASGFASLTAGLGHGFSLTGQVSRGFRDPMLSDRYYRGPTGRGYVTGNPDLSPETSLQLDTALRSVSARYRWALYGYRYRIANLVERYEPTPDFFFFRNRGRALLQGVELEAQADIGLGLQLELGGHIARGRALDDDEVLDDIPPGSISLQLRRAIGSRSHAHVRGAAYAPRNSPGPTERATPGYGVVDAGGGFMLSKRMELRFLARNLFDKEYLASADPRAMPAPGATATMTLVARF
jgi:hemoglobin/transferrin/lactoferrin receptor protein